MLLQEVEIVLTAHPTQINRRTLQYKHLRIAVFLFLKYMYSLFKGICHNLKLILFCPYDQHLLEYKDRADLTHEDRELLIEDLVL